MQKAVTVFVIPWYYVKAFRFPKDRLTGFTKKKRKKGTGKEEERDLWEV